MATASPTGKSVNLYKLLTLTIDQGYKVVRKIFDDAIGNVPLHQFFAQEKKSIQRLISNKVITKAQYDLLFPQNGNPRTTDLDITLAVCLLRTLHVFGLNPHFNWNAPPQQEDTSLEADLRRLLIFRNQLAHVSSTGIDDAVFEQNWSDIEKILLRLNDSLLTPIPNLQQSITNLKNPDAPVIVEEGGLPLQDRRNIKAYRPPKDTCIFDGRLIKLVQEDIYDLNDIICKTSIGSGKFGKVYKSYGVSNGFGMQVAVKKIPFDETDIDKIASMRRV